MVFAGGSAGDAYFVVIAVSVLPLFFLIGQVGLNPVDWVGWLVGVLAVMASSGFRWLIAAGVFWYAATNVLDGGGRYHAGLPVVGFAHTPLFIVPFISRFTPLDSAALVYLLPAAWSVMIMAVGAQAIYDVPREKAIFAGLAGALGYFIALFLFRI